MANPIYLLTHSLLLVFSFLLQSKHKEDTPVTHLILLDEPEFEVCLPLFLSSFLASVPIAMCH